MRTPRWLRKLLVSVSLLAAPLLAGCGDGLGVDSADVTDVKHTDVERQSIGNCWLYAHASWVESMNLNATGTAFDVSQSYWTYWHWYDQITQEGTGEINTGGWYRTANDIVLDRGVMPETKFVKEDSTAEMSSRQSSALAKMNEELKSGRLSSYDARADAALVRKVLDEAWGLSSTVKGQLTKAFGKDGSKTLRSGGTTKYTSIVAPNKFEVRYTKRDSASGDSAEIDATLDVAISEWRMESYPSWGGNLAAKRREFQIRVQRALHDAQPVIITWDVDFNAMENRENDLQGSFNLETLAWSGKPGGQGGHMTVLEDYEVDTVEHGRLLAGVTLDPNDADDAAKLDAALRTDSTVRFFRIKNSWGALRPDREFAPGFPGYHDLYLDYLEGPIKWCPDQDDKTNESCNGTTVPFDSVVLPPGY